MGSIPVAGAIKIRIFANADLLYRMLLKYINKQKTNQYFSLTNKIKFDIIYRALKKRVAIGM